MSDENRRVLGGGTQAADHTVEDGYVIETYDNEATDNANWEDSPSEMQPDEAFVHALRDITNYK